MHRFDQTDVSNGRNCTWPGHTENASALSRSRPVSRFQGAAWQRDNCYATGGRIRHYARQGGRPAV